MRHSDSMQDVGNDKTVLVVDDEPLFRQIARRILERDGYAVLDAADGQEAVDVVAEHGSRIDVMVLDLMMPRLSGTEALQRIRELAPQLRVIVSSAHPAEPLCKLRAGGGPVELLPKPYTADDLLAKVRELLVTT